MSLNAGQKAAKSQIIRFLESKDKFFALSAPAGYGKTFLLNDIRDTVKEHSFMWAATTNKAARILGGRTVHKLFGFNVFKNFQTGKIQTGTKKANYIYDSVICIDEASMLTTEMLKLVDKYTPNSKVILVGDVNQLAPVGESGIPAFTSGFDSATLTEPMRQGIDTHLYKTCTHMRKGVDAKAVMSHIEGEGVFVMTKMHDFLTRLHAAMDTAPLESRVITYTNEQAIRYNKFIRSYLGYGDVYSAGDVVVSRKYTKTIDGLEAIGVEETVILKSVGEEASFMDVPFYPVITQDGLTLRMPKHKEMLDSRIEMAKSSADWVTFFALEESFADLRAGFGITSHSSQGSTYDEVFIDLQDMKKCTNVDTLVRMIYVATSRARVRVNVLV